MITKPTTKIQGKESTSSITFNSIYDYSTLVEQRKDIFIDDTQTYYLLFMINDYIMCSYPTHYDFKGYYSIHSLYYKDKTKVLANFNKIHNFDKVFDKVGDCSVCNSKSGITFGYKLKSDISSLFLNVKMFDKPRTYKKGSFKIVKKYKGETKVYNTTKELMQGEDISKREYERNISKYAYEVRELLTLPCYDNYAKDTNYYDYSHKINVNYEKCEEFKQLFINGNSDFEILQTDLTKIMLLIGTNNKNFSDEIKYSRKSGGRLNNLYGNFNVPLQGLSKEARQFVFSGQYSYDINVSAPTILQGLCKKYLGYSMKTVQDYIDNKTKYRQDLMRIGLGEKEAKQFFTGLFFGASLNENFFINGTSNFSKEFGVSKIRDIMSESTIVVDLYEELSLFIKRFGKHLMTKNVVRTKKGGYALYNSRGIGKEIDITKWHNSKAIIWYYFGIESTILDCLIKKYTPSLLLYDGFISVDDIDVNEMSKLIKDETGYEVTFSKELLGETK